MKGHDKVNQIERTLANNQNWRERTLNLIASENVLSPAVRRALDNDLTNRYADYTERDLLARRYRGSRYIAEIEQYANLLAQQVFHAHFVELRPLSGHIAGVAVLVALTQPGDTVLELGSDAGGYRVTTKINQPTFVPINVHFLPFDNDLYNIDLPAALELIERTHPRVVILGGSNFLFPQPVRQIKDAVICLPDECVLVYDASAVLGFLAAGKFQDPLAEGADVVFGSTHETFPGPQGGLILTNREDLATLISSVVYPILVTNHHPFRMPALGVALAEMQEFGAAYADQMLANAQALGTALDERRVLCVRGGGEYTRSHTILVRLAGFGKGLETALQLEQVDIITSPTGLPDELGREGLRLGVQEITRLGADLQDMSTVADILSLALHQHVPIPTIIQQVHDFTGRLGPVGYTWQK